jgi:UV DNA damage endonuclease|tara:strand:+ start:413 stop:1483 length:1071 start_codon:yes stop_codon:yes gene_type:complete
MNIYERIGFMVEEIIRLGLTCISEELKQKDKKKYSFRSMTRRGFRSLCTKDGKEKAIFELSSRILHNVRVTRYIINHCNNSKISHYRLSSSIFPLITDDQTDVTLTDLPDYLSINEELSLTGKMAKKFNISLGSHPDQFNVLASSNKDAVSRTINELNFQASVLDMLGLPQDHTAPMNIHINAPLPRVENEDVKEGVDPESLLNHKIAEVAENFYDNLMKCDSGVYNRLTIENEDRGAWNVDSIIKFSDYIFQQFKFNLPVCYDNLHDICNPSEVLNIQWQAERCAYTWAEECPPIFHWSEGVSSKEKNPRCHAEYYSHRYAPPLIAIKPDQEVKWECEVKGKDLAIKALRESFSR